MHAKGECRKCSVQHNIYPRNKWIFIVCNDKSATDVPRPESGVCVVADGYGINLAGMRLTIVFGVL